MFCYCTVDIVTNCTWAWLGVANGSFLWQSSPQSSDINSILLPAAYQAYQAYRAELCLD